MSTVVSPAPSPEVPGENGEAAPRQVETGIRTADRVQITEGLAPGDSVIVTGIQQLRPGLPVRVTSAGGGRLTDAEG